MTAYEKNQPVADVRAEMAQSEAKHREKEAAMALQLEEMKARMAELQGQLEQMTAPPQAKAPEIRKAR